MKDQLLRDAEALDKVVKLVKTDADDGLDRIKDCFVSVADSHQEMAGVIVDLVDRLIELEARVKVLEGSRT
jgi:hypothetical protein